MTHLTTVAVVNSSAHLTEEAAGLLFREPLTLDDVAVQFSVIDVLLRQVNMARRVDNLEEPNDVWVIEELENLNFAYDSAKIVFALDFLFVQNLHCYVLARNHMSR